MMRPFVKHATAGLSAVLMMTGAAQAQEKVKLTYVAASMIWPAVVAMAKGFEERAIELGAEPIILDANGSVDGEANAIMDAIQQGTKGVALLPLDSIAAESWVDTTAAANVPIVAVAAPVGDPLTRKWADVYPGLAAYVGKDDVEAGANGAKLAMTLLPKDRKAKIAILEGAPGFAAAVLRSQGFIAELDANKVDYEIVSSQPTDWTPDKGEQVCQNVLISNPDVDLFFSHADDMALGCARALEAAGSEAKLVATSGGSTAGLEAVKAGEIDGTVCMPWETVGRMSADALFQAVTNPDAPKGQAITVDTPLITAANLADCPAQW